MSSTGKLMRYFVIVVFRPECFVTTSAVCLTFLYNQSQLTLLLYGIVPHTEVGDFIKDPAIITSIQPLQCSSDKLPP